MYVFGMVFISRFGRYSVRNAVAGYTYRRILYRGLGVCLFNNVSFVSYIIDAFCEWFAELPATLVSELGCHVDIHFKRVRFELV